MERSFRGGHSLMHGASMGMRKKPRASVGLDRGASMGALWAGRIKRAITVWVGAVALGGNPRKLLARWCGRKKPRASGTRTGQERAWAGGQELSALSAQTRPAPNCSPLCPCRPGESQPLGDARPCLSSIRPELLTKGRERSSNEHQDGQAEGNFAYY